MKTRNFQLRFMSILMLIFTSVFFTGCSKDDGPSLQDPRNGYPKAVTIRYEVSSTSNQRGDIKYTNETGGSTDIADAVLPFSKEVKRTVEFGEIITLLGDVRVINNQAANVTVKMFVNGKLIEEETSEATSGSALLTIGYQFGHD